MLASRTTNARTRKSGCPAAVEVQPLTFAQTVAIRRYSKDAERAASWTGSARIEPAQALEAARRRLTDAERAAVDFLAVGGQRLDHLSRKTGRRPGDLAAIFASAATKLANHYEAEGA